MTDSTANRGSIVLTNINQLVTNDPAHGGLLGTIDNASVAVVDGVIAWNGGAGIEDHFFDGRFHDVMVQVTGDVVRQSQAVFLTAFRAKLGMHG